MVLVSPSARFSGPGATDQAPNLLLLEKLRGMERRTARFVCLIALAENGALLATFRGVVEGEILHEPRAPGTVKKSLGKLKHAPREAASC